jgi:hypothetical protein
MTPLEVVKLTALMQRTSGKAEISIVLIDGPVAINHPNLASHIVRLSTAHLGYLRKRIALSRKPRPRSKFTTYKKNESITRINQLPKTVHDCLLKLERKNPHGRGRTDEGKNS